MLLDVSQLRSLRQDQGWDVPEMGRRLRLAAGSAAIPSQDALVRMIRRWEAGSNGMSERYQLLCRRALESDGHPVTVSAAAPEDITKPAVQGESQVQRREFLTASAAVASSLTVPPQLARLAAGRRIGADVPQGLARRLARLRRLDNYLGGGETYHLYAAELDATKTLAREVDCSQETRRELLAILSEQAQQAGWAAFDAGWQATARTLYQESLTAAQSSGSRALEGNALALLAYQNLTTGEPAAPFADASCEAAGSHTPPRVRALLHERRAWAIAHSAGGQDEARRALDRAAVALEEPDGGPVPDWVAWVDHAELQIMTGRCLTRTGQSLQAIAMLRGTLYQFDETQARDKALYMSWLAEAYLDAGEIDAAAETAVQVLALYADVASVRPAERLNPVLRRLSRYPATASAANLPDRVPRATPGLSPG
jgi:tetratricopeptide (TPR) repeat protein